MIRDFAGSGGGFTSEGNRLLREWNESVESWANFVREGKDYYREEMNNPAFFALVGSVRDKYVLDLACGEGYNTRILARKGARVVGVDFSKKMIELAKEMEKKERLGINYYVLDATDLRQFPSDHFDIVTCLMALMDIERYEKAIREVARVMKKNGRFIFSITHPCFEWGTTADGDTIGEWKYEEETTTPSEKKALHLEVKRYFGIVEVEVTWDMKRLVKPFKTTSFHRTLTDYIQALYRNRLLVRRLVEPKPTAKGTSMHPSLRKHTKVPHSIIIEAIRK